MSSQYHLLYPVVATQNISSQQFDLSLLSCLLRYTCNLNENSPVWTGVPSSRDHSIEADIVRLKLMRNEISHKNSLSLTEQDFQRRWNKIENVILRLGHGIPNLHDEINKLKEDSIDPEVEKKYLETIEEWKSSDRELQQQLSVVKTEVGRHSQYIHELKEASQTQQTRAEEFEEDLKDQSEKIEDVRTDLNKNLDDIKAQQQNDAKQMPSELRNLASTSKLYLEDTHEQQAYVVTSALVKARNKLQDSHLVVLSGLPGEGKTAMAIKLLSEVTSISACLRLRTPHDWTHVDLDQEAFDAIFIDDIFGDGSLDEALLQSWKPYLQDIEKAAQRGRFYVVITLRHYILEEAREKLRRTKIFKDENVQHLVSSDLSDEERLNILQSLLTFAGRKYDSTFLDACNIAFKSAFTSKDIYVSESSFKDNSKPPKTETKIMIGYPEIVYIFATNDTLYSKGAKFFERPVEFFRKCLEDIYSDQSVFLALLLIWSRENKKLNLRDLEQKSVAKDIEDSVRLFGYRLNDTVVVSIRKSLKNHRGGFLKFSSKTGDYTFCHSIVKDMVGIVAGTEHTDAIISLGSQNFIMDCVTTLENKRDDLHLFIEEYRYETLLAKMLNLVMSKLTDGGAIYEEDNAVVIDMFKIMEMPLNTCLTPCYKELCLEDCWNYENVAAFNIDAFANAAFLELFFKDAHAIFLLSKPVASFQEAHGLDTNYTISLTGSDKIYLPSFLLLYGNEIFLSEYLQSKFFVPLSEEAERFLFTSLIIATDLEMENAIETLLFYGAKPNDDVLLIATSKSSRILELLLDKWNCDDKNESHIRDKGSPLIHAARRGHSDAVKLLVQKGIDVNYRNSNGRSALDKAVQYMRMDVCRILLENGAKVNEKAGRFKRTPLHMVADVGKDGFDELAQLLLERGASVAIKDYRGHLPVHCAAIRGHNRIAEILLKADLSQKNRRITSYGRKSIIKGMTLLHIAVWKENIQLMQILLQNNVDADIRDDYGRTPLYCAAFGGKTALVNTLLQVSNAKIAEKNGFTPLHAAIHKRHNNIAKLLCPYSDVNATDMFGKTPLHTACEKCDLEMIKLLVQEYRADVRILTKKGKSVLSLCEGRYIFCMFDDLFYRIQGTPSDRVGDYYACLGFLKEQDPDFAARNETGVFTFRKD